MERVQLLSACSALVYARATTSRKDDTVKLSAQEEYGLRCLVQLGRRGPGGSLTLAELSRLEGLSLPNAAKMMRLLRNAGFVTSVRGQAGGYQLAAPASRIAVGDVLGALGGRLYDADFCRRYASEGEAVCRHVNRCAVRPVWERLQSAVDTALGQLTLAELLGDGDVQGGSRRKGDLPRRSLV